jgi:hypothetical protein
LIISYNNTDLSKLGKEIFSQYDIYCGLRRKEELVSLKENNICDYIFWVDASKRLPPEDNSSCTVTPEMADYIIDNNSDLDNLYKNVEYVMKQICY